MGDGSDDGEARSGNDDGTDHAPTLPTTVRPPEAQWPRPQRRGQAWPYIAKTKAYL